MNAVIEFIKGNWQIILSICLFVLSFILQLLKKKPITDIYSQLYSWIIIAVKEAEKTSLKGQDKLDYAVDYVIDAFKAKFPEGSLPCSIAYLQFLIESILSTPQKK